MPEAFDQPSNCQTSFTAPSARLRNRRCSCTGMAGGKVRMTRRRKRGESFVRRRSRTPALLIMLMAWAMISATMKVKNDEREKVRRPAPMRSSDLTLRP